MWKAGYRWPMVGLLGASTLIFFWFYPILSAAPLSGEAAFEKWMWLDSWI